MGLLLLCVCTFCLGFAFGVRGVILAVPAIIIFHLMGWV